MNQEEEARFVRSYVAETKFVLDGKNVLRRQETSNWASQALSALAASEPIAATRLCILIARSDASEETLERVANGPLLDTLKNASPATLAEIAKTATNEPALRELLSCVWEENELPKPTWAVIRNNSAE